MNKRIALLGKDVSKSPSPAMHNCAFEYLKLPFFYEAISVLPNEFDEKMPALQKGAFEGFNITIPFKEAAIPFCKVLSDQAQKLNAVNTLFCVNGKWHGDNTDIYGLQRALSQATIGQQAVLLGAGGAAKATLEALYSLGITSFLVFSRTQKRLGEFNAWFQQQYAKARLETKRFDEFTKEFWGEQAENFTLFVNSAPLEAYKEISSFSAIHFPKEMIVVDWVYRPVITPWLEKAKNDRCVMVEGYKMLLFQGIAAFKLWTGIDPPENIMEKALMKGLI